jgi:hypothetical protein
MDYQPIRVGAPAVPANDGTAVLFDSTVTLKGGLQMSGVARIRIDLAGVNQASAASGLKGYKSPDKGAHWYLSAFSATGSSASLPATTTADTGADGYSVDIFLGTCADVKFTWTAGATAPTVWNPVITLLAGDSHPGT